MWRVVKKIYYSRALRAQQWWLTLILIKNNSVLEQTRKKDLFALVKRNNNNWNFCRIKLDGTLCHVTHCFFIVAANQRAISSTDVITVSRYIWFIWLSRRVSLNVTTNEHFIVEPYSLFSIALTRRRLFGILQCYNNIMFLTDKIEIANQLCINT